MTAVGTVERNVCFAALFGFRHGKGDSISPEREHPPTALAPNLHHSSLLRRLNRATRLLYVNSFYVANLVFHLKL